MQENMNIGEYRNIDVFPFFSQTTEFSTGPKFKVFADNKTNLIEKLKVVLRMVENIVGKGENAGYQHFLIFPQCFQKLSHSGA